MRKFKYKTLDCVLYKSEGKGAVFYSMGGENRKWEFKCKSVAQFVKILGGKNG